MHQNLQKIKEAPPIAREIYGSEMSGNKGGRGGQLFFGLMLAVVVIWGGFELFGNGQSLRAPLVIGATAPLSGEHAVVGEELRQAAQLAVDEINAGGGVLNQPLHIIWEDGACDEQTAADAARLMVETKSAVLILGGYCNGETKALAAVAAQTGVVILSPTMGNAAAENTAGYFFALLPNALRQSGYAAASYAAEKLGARKAFLIYENTPTMDAHADAFTQRFSAVGGEVVGAERVSARNVPVRSLISAVKQANADAVYLAFEGFPLPANFSAEARRQKITAVILANETFFTPDADGAYHDALDGILGLIPARNPRDTAASEAFLTLYRKKIGTDTLYPNEAVAMYSAVYLAENAVEANGVSTEKIKNWLFTLNNWRGALGTLNFEQDGTRRVLYQAVRVTNGEIEPAD